MVLLLCKAMGGDRALKQCLGRVGRGGEIAYRYRLKSLQDLIDQQKVVQMTAALTSKIKAIKQLKIQERAERRKVSVKNERPSSNIEDKSLPSKR